MNLIEHDGDLLDFLHDGTVDAIAHCCNCQGVMGAGIALQIKREIPDAYAAYKTYENYKGLELGTVSEHTKTPGEVVFNIHAQGNYSRERISARHVDYEAMYAGLEAVRDRMCELDLQNLGIPFLMGCALAGGDWSIVQAMIISVFKFNTITIHIVKFDR